MSLLSCFIELEVGAIASARFDARTGANREVQRTLLELLKQVELCAGRRDRRRRASTRRPAPTARCSAS